MQCRVHSKSTKPSAINSTHLNVILHFNAPAPQIVTLTGCHSNQTLFTPS